MLVNEIVCVHHRKPIANHYDNKILLTLFIGNHENVATIYIIPAHWQDIGSWNSSPYEAGTYQFYVVNIMGADALAMQGATASATMILSMLNRNHSVPAR